ncbi:M55 family metallopeptidase [Streptomyces sp. NPDC050704]|uniref:M55 family metallopeptidase n=1 Tax=Streptomyces sp. NPDC050704 TaxID=3157219 RepID=UPI00341C79E0
MGHEIEDMWPDGRLVGEIGLAHATAAELGVPLVLLSGDDTTCVEMANWDSSVTTVAVEYTRDLYRLFGVWTRVATALTNQAPYC